MAAVEHVGALADFALAGEENQDVAVRLDVAEVVHRAGDVLGEVLVVEGRQEKLRDGKHPAGRLDDRRGHAVEREEFRERPGVEGGGGNDEFQVLPAFQQALHVAEQEVDIE